MAKRSNFDRIEKDYYRTFDKRAGETIKNHLPANYTYTEPFCGRGDLINQLTGKCLFASDIEPDFDNKLVENDFITKDFLEVTFNDVASSDYIITNPPWSRQILHPAIEHFVQFKPTWFLFDANWMFTKQAKPYLEQYCEKIVTIGRLQWIENSKVSGKDDSCWYLFNKDKNGQTEFHARNI